MVLAEVLTYQMCSLKVIDLGDNLITDEAAIQIGISLTVNRTVESLNLAGNKLKD